jgi:hypothetical protein
MESSRKISKYFPDSPAEEHIHFLVEPFCELFEEVASLRALLNKSVYVRIRGSWRLREINFLSDIVLQSLTLS